MTAFARAGPTVDPIVPDSVLPRAKIRVTGAQIPLLISSAVLLPSYDVPVARLNSKGAAIAA